MFVPITPENFSKGRISLQLAVKRAYAEDLDWIESMLRSGLSVRVIAEKSLSLLLYKEIRERLRDGRPSRRCVLVQAPPSGEGRSFMNGMVENLWKQVQEHIGEEESVLVLPHLDLLSTTTETSLGTPAREAIAAMAQDPEITFLAFSDPALSLPKAIEDLFEVKRELVGIRRDILPQLISYEEAQRFGVDQLNLFRLYKYVSGLHAIKLRKVMTRLLELPPLVGLPPEEREPQRRKIEKILREMTLLGGMEIPTVDLDADIGGYNDVKKRIREEILDILQLREDPQWSGRTKELEETLPRGFLFYGPPGTGKTYFAKAMASAINATAIVVSGPEIKSKWVGESESNLRRIFAQARSAAPAIIIFDEIDAIAPQRGTYQGSGVEHSIVNQLLTEMDGFRKEEMVFVVGTTNFSQSVDPALLRPGRFEYQLHIPYPDRQARRDILSIYAKRFDFSIDDASMNYLLERTGAYVDPARGMRYSGDHLYGIARQLKRLQARNRDQRSPFPISRKEIDAVMGAAPFRSKKKRERERLKATYHEAAHALLAALLLGVQAIQKATIEADHPDVEGMVSLHAYVTQGATRQTMTNLIQVALAGRAAEEMIFQEQDIGAKNDLDIANEMARLMVEEMGMSERFGARVYRSHTGQQAPVGAMTRELIDKEINLLLQEQLEATTKLLKERRADLEALTTALGEKGELTSQEIAEILGIPYPKDEMEGDADARPLTHA
jgi:cell division protease FtsH